MLVDQSFGVKELRVSPPGEAAVREVKSQYVVAMRHSQHAPPVKPGPYDVFISIGQREGTPVIALPLPGGDGQLRYKVGQMILK